MSWEARCGKSARRVSLGGRGTRATEASLYQPRYLKVREDGQTILYRHDDEDEDIDLASTMRALARFRQAVFIPENLVQYVQGDLRRMALFFVRQLIDEKVESGVTVRMMYDPEQDRLDLQVVPKSLLGALWYQCARSLDEHRRYRRCLECGMWFEISEEGSRTSRLFHSNACRNKAYRKRQATAQQLFTSGISVEEIAQQLESDVKSVQGWLTAPKRRRSPRS